MKIKISVLIIAIFILLSNVCNIAKNIDIYANSYICYDRKNDSILLEKNAYTKIPIASTTKIMTAILTMEYGKLDEVVTASRLAQNTTGQQLNLKQGNKIILKDLLYAIMLYSANDGAIAIAEHIGGSVEDFCIMMNEKAKKLGANNTNFVSPHGLDNSNHYSTAYDLALITNYALNIKGFSDITSTKSYTININGYNRNINNTNKLIHTMNNVTGTKTGFTNNAGYCLVSNMNNNEKDIIVVVLGANTSKQRFEESKKILEYCFENMQTVDLNDIIKDKIEITVDKSDADIAILEPIQSRKISILKDNINNIEVNYYVLEKVEAPIKKTDVLAKANIYINKKKIATVEYSLIGDINKKNYTDYIAYIINNIGTFLKLK